MKRILIISTPPEFGGGETYVLSLIKRLPEFEFVVMTNLLVLREEVAQLNGPRVRSVRLAVKFYTKYQIWLSFILQPFIWIQLIRVISIDKPDLIHVQSHEERLSVWLPAIIFRIPVIWTMHGSIDTSGSKLYSNYLRIVAQSTKRIICISKYVQESVVKAGVSPDKLTVIYNGVDTKRFKPMEPLGPYITYIGRFEEVKNPSLFIDAAAIIHKQYPLLEFKMIGDGSLFEECIEQATKLELNNVLQFEGYKNDILPHIQASRILVIPSRDEGMSIVAAEAMSCGIPIVATAVGGLVEVVSDGLTGILTEPNDAVSLANGILSIYSSPSKAISFGAQARTLAKKKFDVKLMLNSTKGEYERVLSK